MTRLIWCPELGCYMRAYPGADNLPPPGPATSAYMNGGEVTIVLEFTQDE